MSGFSINLSPQGNYAQFTYNVVSDTYSQLPVHGFSSQAFHVNNVQRVEEHDWKMVYLSREHGDRPGNVSVANFICSNDNCWNSDIVFPLVYEYFINFQHNYVF